VKKTGALTEGKPKLMDVLPTGGLDPKELPWALTFSFSRAIQQPALEIWKGDESQVLAAQQALSHRARCNRAARRGEYDAAMEVANPVKPV
jgi:fructose-bisphosphate aldolase class I